MKINKQKIKLIIAEQCLSLTELSKKTGIATSTLTKILNGKQNPREKTVGLIAKHLNISVIEILENENK